MEYTVIIEKAANNYGAYVPDLLGCVSTGQTIEETKRNIREASSFTPKACVKMGIRFPYRAPRPQWSK